MPTLTIHQERSQPNTSEVLAIILISYVMIVLDISIVITGLPKIHAELGFSDAGLSWVANAYTLTFGGLLLLGARAGDILGRRRLFIVGLTVFSAASLAIGVAQSAAWLVAARGVQGIGAAILAPSILALLQVNFAPGPARTRAVAYYAAAAGVSASVGLVLGGILADWLSWRVGFFINLPIGFGLILAARRYVGETELRPGALDIPGAITSTAGMTALVYGIVSSAVAGWNDRGTIASLIVGVVLLGVFVLNERWARQPIMPLRLFASRERSGAYATRLLFVGATVGFFFFSTQFLQGAYRFGPALTGVAFLPATITNFVMALMVPKVMPRIGGARLLAISLAMSVVGMAWLSQVSPTASYVTGVALPMLLIGIGQGGAMAPLTAFGIADVGADDAGAASGLVNAAHQLGGSLGLGVLIAIAGQAVAGLSGPALLTYRVDAALTGSTAMLGLAMVIVLLTVVRPRMVQTQSGILNLGRHSGTSGD